MNIRGRRGIGALVMLIVLVLGGLAVLPMTAVGQNFKLQGTVSDCAGTLVEDAVVILSDANGHLPDQSTTTDLGGVYSFTPGTSGSFNLRVSRNGYFPNETTSPIRFDNTAPVNRDLCMDPTPGLASPKTLTVTVTDASSGAVLAGAFVQAYFAPRNQVVESGTTNASGKVDLVLWAATFELRTNRTNYTARIDSVNVAAVSTFTVAMGTAGIFQGHAKDPSGVFLSAGLQGFLYNTGLPNTSGVKVFRADIFGTLYRFHAPPGTYRMVIDANGHLADVSTVTVTAGSTLKDVTLQVAPREVYSTEVVFPRPTEDWSNLTVYRNVTLNHDSDLRGLDPGGLRDLRLQIDFTFGNGNGVIDGSEATFFQNWLVANGPFYVTTDGFFTTNSRAYVSALSSSVTVTGLSNPGGRIWINTTTSYALKNAPPQIPVGAKTYFLNMTMVADSNVSTYKDFVYLVALPKRYELNTTTFVPAGAPITTANYTRVTINPGLTNTTPQIRMTVSHSLSGTARAKVIAPTGKFFVQNATFTNYQAFVANNTTLTFSARDSTDPNDHIEDANYTWNFTGTDVRYGIEPQFKYVQSGTFTVNLTMVETGLNVSYREFTLFVDDTPPVARIKTNRTGIGNANGTTLRVDQGVPVRFDGTLSTDLAYPGKNGVIPPANYAWDFDGNGGVDATGRIVNWTFPKPGAFRVNLTVTDGVGWKSVNATMQAQVNDTKAPVPGFDILDPANDYAVITSPMERRPIAFNASKTTDDFSTTAMMNFTWTIPGPISVGGTPLPGTNHTLYGVNVTFTWQEWNNSYKVVLTVKDSGFRGPDPGRPNWANLTRNITVQIDVSIHADLRVVPGTAKVSPTDPEEGAPVTFTLNVTNKPGRATAANVTVTLTAISGGVSTGVPATVQWFKGGVETGDRTIPASSTVTLVITGRLSGQGNKTLRVQVCDSTEPYTWCTSENRAQENVNVRQPGWQPFAIAGAVIGIIALFVFGMYARRKIKAGEWRPIRGRRGEKGGEEKPRREAKEEKKRL